MYNDEQMWTGIREGNKEMYLLLYRRYYHTLLFIGLKQYRDADLVKDAIQQQFLYLWEKRSGIKKAENVRAYLITSFLRRLRQISNKVKICKELEVEDIGCYSDMPLTPEENMIAMEGQNHLNRFLMRQINLLPKRQKELVVLKFYQGLNYNEIVEKTGLSPRTVYNKMHEALKSLKLNLEDENVSYKMAISHVLTIFLWSLPYLFFLKK